MVVVRNKGLDNNLSPSVISDLEDVDMEFINTGVKMTILTMFNVFGMVIMAIFLTITIQTH